MYITHIFSIRLTHSLLESSSLAVEGVKQECGGLGVKVPICSCSLLPGSDCLLGPHAAQWDSQWKEASVSCMLMRRTALSAPGEEGTFHRLQDQTHLYQCHTLRWPPLIGGGCRTGVWVLCAHVIGCGAQVSLLSHVGVHIVWHCSLYRQIVDYISFHWPPGC